MNRWAVLTKVTRSCQPGQMRPSKWSNLTWLTLVCALGGVADRTEYLCALRVRVNEAIRG